VPGGYGIEIGAQESASDYEVVVIAAPEGGIGMMVVIDSDDDDETGPEVDEADEESGKKGSGRRPDHGGD
jgi:hypothetical protein